MDAFANNAMDSRANTALAAKVHDPITQFISLKRPQQALVADIGCCYLDEGCYLSPARMLP